MRHVRVWFLVLVSVLVVALTSVGVTLAGPPTPPSPPTPPAPQRPPVVPQNNQSDGTTPEGTIQVTPLRLINYQGKLLQNGSPYNGNIDITFRLYVTETAGAAPFWQETQNVAVTNGLFNVLLGAVTPMADAQEFHRQVWLGIQPAGASAELTPRQPLSTVGYAMNLLPGATMVDPGLPGYWTSFYVESHGHPAIFGSSDTDIAITGETRYTDTSAIAGSSYGSGGRGVYGYAENNGTGVYGVGVGTGGWAGGIGVYGEGTGGLFSTGVYGRSGLWGVVGAGFFGVAGSSDLANGVGVYGSAAMTESMGVFGNTDGYTDCSYGSTICGAGVYGTAGGDAYGSYFYGENRSAIIGTVQPSTYYGLWVDTLASPDGSGIWTNGESRFLDYVTFSGGKSGYVVDIARNGGTGALERGDVVVISGYDSPVVGNIPVIVVTKASEANATGVVGVVDVLYVPCDRPQEELQAGEACGGFEESMTTIQPGQYLAVVTLGAYGYIKVDASGGPIRPGDLLAASPSAGYATKAPLLTVEGVSFHAPGTIIGKALGGLDKGTGVIPVFVSAR